MSHVNQHGGQDLSLPLGSIGGLTRGCHAKHQAPLGKWKLPLSALVAIDSLSNQQGPTRENKTYSQANGRKPMVKETSLILEYCTVLHFGKPHSTQIQGHVKWAQGATLTSPAVARMPRANSARLKQKRPITYLRSRIMEVDRRVLGRPPSSEKDPVHFHYRWQNNNTHNLVPSR